MRTEWGHFIGGASVAGSGMLEIVDPAVGEPFASSARGAAAEVDRAVRDAQRAWKESWRLRKPAARAEVLFRLSRLILDHLDELSRMESRNTGKPLRSTEAEVRRAARYFEYYAGAPDKFFGDTGPPEESFLDFTWNEPLGVTAHILPWNFPLPVLARSVAPALAMGNAVVVKPAEQTPLTALRAAELAIEAGVPSGVFNVVTGLGEETGAPLVSHPLVRAVAFTGSVETGRAVLRLAAERIIPVMPELGGKSPNLVFADADLDLALENAIQAIFANSGQTCIAGSRLLVEAPIRESFAARLAERARSLRLGPGETNPDLGPLISEEQRKRVQSYCELAVSEGARLVTGGRRPAQPDRGFFFEPTIFDRVEPSMRIAREEIFGPVLCILPFRDESEALSLANDTGFGLAAGIFSRDLSRVLRLARDIDAGRIFVNQYPSGDVNVPFGGNKESGYGRACGIEALRHFVQVKSVTVRYEGTPTC
ncbi:MAG: aldehyde dehydrogenase family protein [Bryobacterales bacterium]|nr:aldehyde dehydrogenase family protein [Bryobacterales bacterium]